jgi:hypothetical protein
MNSDNNIENKENDENNNLHQKIKQLEKILKNVLDEKDHLQFDLNTKLEKRDEFNDYLFSEISRLKKETLDLQIKLRKITSIINNP